ncbi:MAG: glycerophosphodiester phosphodiesterase [Acidimicrobiales bacterium]
MIGSGANPWLDRRVISYAHQGGAWESPSSTCFAIRRALKAGATGIELDVHATADGELVVSHDSTVDRTTDGTGEIADLTLSEVRKLDNAYWFVPGADVTPGLEDGSYPYRGRAPEDREFGIATLAEALAVVEEFPGVVVNLDIKQTAPQVKPYEEQLATQLESLGHLDDVIVASFNDNAIAAFRSFTRRIATSAGTLETAEFWRAVHSGADISDKPFVALQVPTSHSGLEIVDEVLISAAHDRGIAVHVWTVNGPAQMERLLDLGVDGIISDLPTTLCSVLFARGVGWRASAPRSTS